jgi:FkbM family methyltransferase
MFETVIKKQELDGVSEWVWPKEDEGLWYGPSMEWIPTKEAILTHCSTFNTAVQAGGACGMYPKLMSKMFHKVFTFEPDPYNFYCLSQNCTDTYTYKFNCVLGDRHRNITYNPPANTNRGTGSISPVHVTKKNNDVVGNVPMLRVDDFVYDKVDLIQLDVEGSELYVLLGARNSIRKHFPLIILETVNGEINDLLKDEGYEHVGKAGIDTVFKHRSLL